MKSSRFNITLIILLPVFVLLYTKKASAQNDELYTLDSSKITLRVSGIEGCVISPVNEMVFRLYTDSTVVRFVSFDNQLNEIDLGLVVVPYNLRHRIENYYRSMQNNRLDITSYFRYRLEFEGVQLYGDYRLEEKEQFVLVDWFEEFSKESQSTH